MWAPFAIIMEVSVLYSIAKLVLTHFTALEGAPGTQEDQATVA